MSSPIRDIPSSNATPAPRILVTGGTRRLGGLIAASIARQGGALLLHHSGRSAPPDGLAERLRALGAPEVRLVSADLRSPEALDALAEAARAFAVSGVVHSAAVWAPTPVADARSTAELARAWTDAFAVNVVAPGVLDTRLAALDSLRHIVHVGDCRTAGGWPGRSAYLASKAALDSLTRTLALELDGRVRVVGVAPGPMWPEDFAPDVLERIRAKTPGGMLADPASVADLAASLACGAWPELNGAILPVDGGRSIPR